MILGGNLIGENREYGGNQLYKDLIPKSSWCNNVRRMVSSSTWDKIRKKAYERVNYKCECCNYDCKTKENYPSEYYENGEILSHSSEFKPDVELRKWNRIQLEAHERWSYDEINNMQKIERIVALCHRCHSATHMGLASLRGVDVFAKKNT